VARRIDLNADVGEGFPHDEALLTVVSSANVACGFHAGDAQTMVRVCSQAVQNGVVVGAQPSYRDREGFGRRPVDISGDRLLADLIEQLDALDAAAAAAGAVVTYIKPHGALYNRAVVDDEHAAAVVECCVRRGLPVLGLPGSRLLALARARGVATFQEFFADRGYDGRGHLVARTEPGAVLTDGQQVADRIGRLARSGSVVAADGSEVSVEADSVCVHGDTPGAVELAQVVRRTLEESGAVVGPFA
jgi:UPF0271 protein